MIIHYNATGQQRKKLAQSLGAILLWEPVYAGAPTFAYKVGNYTVDKTGDITCPDSATRDIVDGIVEKLKAEGFTPESIEADIICPELPRNSFTNEEIDRLRQLIANKEPLFKRAFQTDAVPLNVSEDKVAFPWFRYEGLEGETDAYLDFVTALCRMAKTQTRILDKPYTDDNDKFAMRLFLVRLNLKGEQYKRTRQLLMRNLTGNTAWRSGSPPADREVRRASRRFPSRTTVQHLTSAYPAGLRVQLVPMDEANTTMPQIRARGTVVGVDDAGSVFVSWDNGSGVGLAFSAEHDGKEVSL